MLDPVSSLRSQLLALVALLLLALPLSLGGRDVFFCNAMGRVMDSCCCAAKAGATHDAAESNCRHKVERQDCCEQLEGSHVSAAATREQVSDAPLPVFAVLADDPCVVPDVAWTGAACAEAVEARGPPPTGPPLYLKHCAFLN